MRVAVLDAGSNAVNLLVGEMRGSGFALQQWKTHSFVAADLRTDGSIGPEGRARLLTAVGKAVAEARRVGVEELFPYATAVIRDAPGRDEVVDEIAALTGVRLGTLTGVEEAEATFLGARRWLGHRKDPMLLADIGGGSLELAFGHDRTPDWAVSLDLGARVLTRRFLRGGESPARRATRDLRRHVRAEVCRALADTSWESRSTAVAASKTFQQLARLTGAPPLRRGPNVTRRLHRRRLSPWIDRLAAMPASRRAKLPGVSEHRASQIVAGSIVADEVMRGLGLTSLRISPWGLREGLLLCRFETDRASFVNAGWRRLS
jgi:exopolyphosphatase/guanosine-5'-triphosphate,3'-diphosphate pyrophosphatase